MNTHTKQVDGKELQFYVLAASKELAPRIISMGKGENGKIDLVTEKMPIVLINVMNTPLAETILDQARDLVSRLHRLNILHNDLSEENIVYNPETNRTYLIDFGLSEYLSSIQPEEIPSMIENLYESVRYSTGAISATIDCLKRVELGVISFLLEKSKVIKF